jgi:predicted RNA binding protein YcfA (HicA-like mRNA interferase family)
MHAVLESEACIRISKTMDSRTIIRRLETDGWALVRVTGSHHHFRHPRKPGTVTVPHPRKDMPVGTRRSIERQSGVGLGA